MEDVSIGHSSTVPVQAEVWRQEAVQLNRLTKGQKGAITRRAGKKGGSTVAMLPEGNSQNHSWQKDFGNSIALVLFFTIFV